MSIRKRVLASITALVSAAAMPTVAPSGVAAASGDVSAVQLVDRYRKATWRWQRLMRVPLTPARQPPSSRETFRRDTVLLWHQRARRAYRQAHSPPYHEAWLCIHRYEGPWTANTGNGYYGGLQMDIAFQRTYGSRLLVRKGPAHRWLPIEQIWVAVRAHRSGRGFYPWPNTARRCGLI
ncbi:MAG: transglycosylase family protein [Actinobacteria bacterium]|nr:transglycosylase family protein [Actinomycetota bacterium]